MIAKIKLIHGDGDPDFIFKRWIDWVASFNGPVLQPQVGMTVIIPHGLEQYGKKRKTFRFYITHLVADLRNKTTVMVERRKFGHMDKGYRDMLAIANQLRELGWEEEDV